MNIYVLVDYTGREFEFKNEATLLDFVNDHLEFWDTAVSRNSGVHFNLAMMHEFRAIKSDLSRTEGAPQEHMEDSSSVDPVLRSSIQARCNQLRSKWLWAYHSFVETYVQVNAQNPKIGSFFVSAVGLYPKHNQMPRNLDEYYAANLVFEFIKTDVLSLPSRADQHEVQLNNIKDKFLEKLDEAREIQRQVETEQKQQKQKEEKVFADISNRKEKIFTDISNRKVRLFRVWEYLGKRKSKEYNSAFDKLVSASLDKRAALEKSYDDLLKLQKPAKYWGDSATTHGWSAFLYICMIFLVLSFAFYWIYEVFSLWLTFGEAPFGLGSIQGALIFGTGVAFVGFLARALSRLAFSSVHLRRDCQERELLTNLYLSLIRESSIDSSSRDIVLQSLFSRSETGLLANDGSVTMPMVSDLSKIVSSSRTTG